MIFLFKWVIFRLQRLVFRGVAMENNIPSPSPPPVHLEIAMPAALFRHRFAFRATRTASSSSTSFLGNFQGARATFNPPQKKNHSESMKNH